VYIIICTIVSDVHKLFEQKSTYSTVT